MFPKLNPEPVLVDINRKIYNTPREKIAAAYAGACAAKEGILSEMSGGLLPDISFKEHYIKALPGCINAANQVGLSATVETLDYFNPGKILNHLIADKLEHKDNPFYPFFEED